MPRGTHPVTVGTLELKYKPGVSGPELPEGLVRAEDAEALQADVLKFRFPQQRGDQAQRRRRDTVQIPFFRTRQGAPGLTPVNSVTVRPRNLLEAKLVNTKQVEVPNL